MISLDQMLYLEPDLGGLCSTSWLQETKCIPVDT